MWEGKNRGSKRVIALRNVAYELGLTFMEKDEYGILNLLLDFKLFKQGGRKRIYNIIREIDSDKELLIFDYHYTVSSNNSSKTYRQSVVLIHSKHFSLPFFLVRPEHLMDKVAAYFGWNDIDFDTYPEFSKKFFLKSNDKDYTRSFFESRMLRRFRFSNGWYMEGNNFYLISYRKDKLLDPASVTEAYNKSVDIYGLLKDDEANWKI